MIESSPAVSTTTHQETSTSIIGDNATSFSTSSSTNQHPLTSSTILNHTTTSFSTSVYDALPSSMTVYLAPYGPGSGEVYEGSKQGLIDRRRGLLQAIENILPTPAHTTAVSPRPTEVNKSESTPAAGAVTQNITINEHHHHHHYYNDNNNQPLIPPETHLNDDTHDDKENGASIDRKHRYIYTFIHICAIHHYQSLIYECYVYLVYCYIYISPILIIYISYTYLSYTHTHLHTIGRSSSYIGNWRR